MHGKMVALSVLALCSACVPYGPGDRLLRAEVTPTTVGSRKNGCELSFTIARRVPGGWRMLGASLWLFSANTRQGVDLLVGIKDKRSPFQAPAAGALLDHAGISNEGEVRLVSPPDSRNTRTTLYNKGPKTESFLVDLASGGVPAIRVTMNDRSTEVWRLDLAQKPEARAAWVACTASIPPPAGRTAPPS